MQMVNFIHRLNRISNSPANDRINKNLGVIACNAFAWICVGNLFRQFDKDTLFVCLIAPFRSDILDGVEDWYFYRESASLNLNRFTEAFDYSAVIMWYGCDHFTFVLW